jgi:predicted O-methyltransferase YrrM
LREVFARGKVFNEQGAEVALSSNVSESEAALLQAAVKELRPTASAEVGFAQGVSTLAILEALRQSAHGHHHVIDPFQRNYQYCGRAMVARARLGDRYSFYEKFPEDVIPGLPRLQFAFIDSSHLFDLTMCEFVLMDRKLDVGGVVGFHDMWMESQQAFIRYVLANRAYEVWHPGSWPAPVETGEAGWKKLVRSTLGSLPGGRRMLAREFLRPWQEFGLGNLVLLRKQSEDRREWTYHQKF